MIYLYYFWEFLQSDFILIPHNIFYFRYNIYILHYIFNNPFHLDTYMIISISYIF